MKSRMILIAAATAALTMLAGNASAQSNDARAAAASERNVSFYRPGDFSVSATPTDHDIVLMQPTSPWYLTLHGEVTGTDNAYLTAPKHGDVYASGTADAGFQSTIAESFDLQVGGQLSATRFHRYSELDTDTIAGIVSISKMIDNVRYGVEYIPAQYYSRGFNDRVLNSNELAVFGRWEHEIDDKSIGVIYARLSQRWTDPHDFDNTRFAVTAACQHQCLPALTTNIGVTLAYSYYNDYFMEVTSERRRDLLVMPFISAVYTINDYATIGVSLSYGRNYSSISQTDYEAAAFTPYVELNWRF